MTETPVDILKRHEGYRQHPYKCTAGRLSIGYGRNLDDVGISRDEAEYLLSRDYQHAFHACRAEFYWFAGLSDVRRAVVAMMVFNLGMKGFKNFRKTIAYIANGEYENAAMEMLDSKWRNDVGQRAFELSAMMNYNTFEV